MKATLVYNLNDEGDLYQYKCAIKGQDLYFVITDLDNELRNIIKYGDGQYTEEQQKMAEFIRNRLHDFRSEREAYIEE